jgi:uncharacterized protein (TIGR03435 family)
MPHTLLATVGSISLGAALLAGSAWAQQPASGANARSVEVFEAASVRKNVNPGGPVGANISPNGVQITGYPLRELIRAAYGPRVIVTRSQMVGGPGWMTTDRFDITARAAGDFGPGDPDGGLPPRLLAMIRALLEDRFKLRIHFEQREQPIYALVLARDDRRLGPHMKVSLGDCQTPPFATRPERPCGVTSVPGTMTFRAVDMPRLVRVLAGFPEIGRVVQEQTGLEGAYDMQLQWTPGFIDSINPGGTPVADPNADQGTSLFSALQEQLGLKLESRRAAVDVLVIDSVEPPTEN